MNTDTKVLRFQVEAKAAKGRTFSGFASTPDIDLGGDIVEPTAFTDTIAKWKRTAGTIPLLDSHQGDSVTRILGKLVEAKIQADGLWTRFQVVETPRGDEVLSLVRGGYLDGLSIGYRVLKSIEPTTEEQGRGAFRRLTQVGLHEVSLVAFPMNEGARVTDATKGRGSLVAADDPERLQWERRLSGHYYGRLFEERKRRLDRLFGGFTY